MHGFPLVILPDADEPDAAEVLVDATLDGRPYRFLLDTGAGTTCVACDSYTSTFPSEAQHRATGVFAQVQEDRIVMPSITLGPLARTDFPVARAVPLASAQDGPADDGHHRRNLLGMDFLHDACLCFRFEEPAHVVVETGEPPPGDFPTQDLFLDKKFHPYVKVMFGACAADAVWDTGASLTVVDTAFAAQHPALFQEAGHTFGTDATGCRRETPLFTMGACVIGGAEFGPQTVAGVDLSHANATLAVPMHLILGYTTLRHADWWFDFPRRRWAILRLLSLKAA